MSTLSSELPIFEMLGDPAHPSWSIQSPAPWLSWPKFTTFRPHQITAVHRIVDAFRSGAPVVILDAPVGSGKSLIADMTRRLLLARSIYTCLTPDSLVRTTHGYEPISEIQTGDRVIGLDGAPAWVARSIPNHHNGKVLEIVTAYRGESIKVTPDHRVQIVSRVTSGEAWEPVSKLGQAERRWVRADELRHGQHVRDYVVWPIASTESEVADDAWVATIGWYVCEGFTGAEQAGTRYQTTFALGSHEQGLVDDLVIHLTDQGYEPKIRDGETNTLLVSVNSVVLAGALEFDCGRHAPTKRLPGWVMNLPRRQRQLLLDILVSGDGSTDGRHCQYATTSQQLALQVRELALSLGFLAGVSRSPARDTEINGRTIHGRHDSFNVRWDTAPVHPHGYVDDHVAYLPIVDIIEHDYDGLVYDIEVPNGSAFCTASGIAHNCTTKSLQDQLARDFADYRVIKGKANYPTQHGDFPEINCGDCTQDRPGDDCMWCDQDMACGYKVARGEAQKATTAILNTAYFLLEASAGEYSKFSGREFVVIDEADELESALMGHVEVVVSDFWLRRLGIGVPQVKTADAKSNDWLEWAEDALEAAQHYAKGLNPPPGDVRGRRHRSSAYSLIDKLRMLVEQLPEGGWVYDGYGRRKPTVLFKPIMVDRMAHEALWQHGEQFLLMSGSVISPTEMADSLGIEDFEAIDVKVNWPVENRPIYVSPVANVTYRNQDQAYPRLAETLAGITDHHPDERILVHTVSYKLTEYLVDELVRHDPHRPIFTYDSGRDREAALEKFKATPGSVILAPSLDRGIDLPDDLCRVQVVVKVPYPSFGDKQVATRANMGKRGRAWYQVQTIRSVVQMLGRGIRHENDWAVSYIIDKQFTSNVMRRGGRRMIPDYLKESMIFGEKPWKESDHAGT